MDEFDLEVTDLRTGAQRRQDVGTATSAAAGPAAGAHGPATGQTPPTAGASYVPPVTHRRPAQRRRLLGAVAASVAVLLALVTAVLSLSDPAGTLGALLHQPTPLPTATLAFNADTFAMIHTMPWGSLTVDGRPVSAVDPRTGFFTLPRGRHTLLYRADPFPPRRCVVSVPATRSDTCPLVPLKDMHTDFPPSSPLRVLDAGDTLTRLPAAQRAALIEAIQQTFNPPGGVATVAPGEHYLMADGSIAVATQPLSAALIISVNQDPARQLTGQSYYGAPTSCVDLCEEPSGSLIPGALPGQVMTHLVVNWRFTAPDGTAVATSALPPGAPDPVVPITVRWNNGWQVQSMYHDVPECEMAASAGQELAKRSHILMDSPAYPAPNYADGCLGLLSPSGATGGVGPPPPYRPAYVLYRFGVLLAANPLAQQEFPTLPVADAQEQALAQQIAAPVLAHAQAAP